jgi:NADH-quinone oxidoreductase subunit L
LNEATAFSESLALLSLFVPLFSFVISILIHERYSWVVSLLSSLLLLSSVVTSGILLFSFFNEPEMLLQYEWFTINQTSLSANLLLSPSSRVMLFVVSIISFLVHLYSIGYMAGDMDIKRYFAMLGFFTFSMQGIVLADSLLVMFLFWELVGFSSYMLIGHFMMNERAGTASKKAFIINRIGDVGFIVGLMIVWNYGGTFDLSELAHGIKPGQWQTAASLCLFCGVIGKSAQFPLFTWLPDAMEGPTPVSALIHAATMVAAGVYLMSRVFFLFSTTALAVVAIIGALTSLIGALAALSQFDIKKILAYSTMSQLGLMLMAMGVGLVNEALLHLFTHAFFKACLFLCAGAVIHSLHQAQHESHVDFDVQDIRNLGGLATQMRVTFITFLISTASLAGIPFFSGFLSKEAIITAIVSHNNLLSWIVLVFILATSFLTVLYSFRLIWYTFLAKGTKTQSLQTLEVPYAMRIPMVVLAASSLWFMFSWNPFQFAGWIITLKHHQSSWGLTIGSILWVSFALLAGYYLFRRRNATASKILRHAFHLDTAYSYVAQRSASLTSALASYTDTKVIDRSIHLITYAQVTIAHVVGWIDRTFVDGFVHFIARIPPTFGSLFRGLQDGKIQVYIFWSAFAIIIFIICALI